MAKIDRLLEIMERLRDPEDGCVWDLEQTFETIAPYTIEEAYEVEDAVRRGDLEALRDELGDLLLQVVFHAQIAREAGRFDFDDVVEAICEKLVRRHPNVFGDADVATAEAQVAAWEEQKARERRARAERSGERHSVLDDVPRGLPALLRAAKLGRRAARLGFDFPDAGAALAKLEEEVGELGREVREGAPPEAVARELGDALFAAAQLARKLGLDPEEEARDANARFERRVRAMEAGLEAERRDPATLTADEWLALWRRVRRGEARGEGAGRAARPDGPPAKDA